ncbi:putative entry exclusion protein TrbK-alt [Sphingopyxis terrae]|uniref:putative entry exclusion protein TrbK-alt n=1 Tax=Sphingopyxis terrae TaxID=33052 RepID=UPI002A0D2999|nr:putative entry exclusion protein TrbK-alt [Sphingopyxis terrae]MDX8356446.1 putative entry exclusion protein TrbK-alt [Sphingopyxis terrae]
MGRAGKLVAGAIVGGMALTFALLAAVDPPAPQASVFDHISGADAGRDLGETLRRCRTVTVADAECEAAWETKRRHFFGQERQER